MGELTIDRSCSDPAPRARSTIYRFHFPVQEHAIAVDSTPQDPETQDVVETVVYLDDDNGGIDIKRGNTRPAPTAKSLIPTTS